MPIFNKKSYQARAEDECVKLKFPLFTTIKVEISVWDIPELEPDEIFCWKFLHEGPPLPLQYRLYLG